MAELHHAFGASNCHQFNPKCGEGFGFLPRFAPEDLLVVRKGEIRGTWCWVRRNREVFGGSMVVGMEGAAYEGE